MLPIECAEDGAGMDVYLGGDRIVIETEPMTPFVVEIERLNRRG